MFGSGPGPRASAPPGPHERGKRRRISIAIAIVVMVVAAGLSVYVVTLPSSTTKPGAHTYPPPPSGWTTFRSAWAAVSQAFEPFANGNWTVIFAEGVAADAPWSPPATLWYGISPAEWNPCAAQLSGISTLTFWNSSLYPASSSLNVFSSGAAPLWTFVFNGTGTSTFVASWFVGKTVINAVLGPGSPCLSVSSPRNVFVKWPFDPVLPATESDSNAIASAAIAEEPNASFLHVAPVPTPPQTAFALYFPGPQFTPNLLLTGPVWSVEYGACGSPGQTGTAFTLTDYLFDALKAVGGEWSSSTFGCADSLYNITMSRVLPASSPSPTGVYREWNLTPSFLTSAVPANLSLANLTTSWIQWRVGNPSDARNPPVPPSAAVCRTPGSSISNCTPPSSGWYAVLLRPSGSLLDSYPDVANGTTWTVPMVHVSSADRILFVGASGFPTNTTIVSFQDAEPMVSAGADIGSS